MATDWPRVNLGPRYSPANLQEKDAELGLDLNGVRFLLYAQKLGVDFGQTAMLGRQSLDLNRYELKKTLRSYGYSGDTKLSGSLIAKNEGYAEALLTYIGAKTIHSYDISSYEGATHIHDMNAGISSDLSNQYTVVLDGGSLEHVFNFPTAVKNCMEMLKIGGHFLGITPANNFMGHGLYQFSPELYYNIFTQENGFKLKKIIAFEDKPGATWYLVRDPKEVKSRIQIVNNHPVYLLIIAQKMGKASIFETTPQQSDYVTAWNQGESKIESKSGINRSQLAAWAKRNLPFFMVSIIKNIMMGAGFNRRFFESFNPLSPDKWNDND